MLGASYTEICPSTSSSAFGAAPAPPAGAMLGGRGAPAGWVEAEAADSSSDSAICGSRRKRLC